MLESRMKKSSAPSPGKPARRNLSKMTAVLLFCFAGSSSSHKLGYLSSKLMLRWKDHFNGDADIVTPSSKYPHRSMVAAELRRQTLPDGDPTSPEG